MLHLKFVNYNYSCESYLSSIATIVILFTSCTKSKNFIIKFGWVKEGTKLYYDYYRPTDTLHDYRYLTIVANRFFEQDPSYPSTYQTMFNLPNKDFVAKPGGLYGLAYEDCNSFFNSRTFDFLYAPNSPSINQEIDEYGCGRQYYSIDKIIEINKTVNVPKGTYTTYVMLHFNGDKSYWNPDEGLIMYERYVNGYYVGTLKLTRII